MAPKNPPQDSDAKPEADASKGPFALISTSHGKPRRRAGMRFTPEGVRVDLSRLDEAQKTAIQNDPVLKVRPLSD